MRRLFLPLVCFFLLPVFLVSSQEGDASAAAEASAESENPELPYVEMDIRTSSLMELAVWCRELGLSEGGTKDDLATRLRAYYRVTPGPASGAEQRVITIESARTTEYFTLDVVDEEYARLRGDVIVSLKDGNAVHRIKAWEILYNRTRNVMTASGNVEYVREEGDTVETFRGESITVNLDNWSSIFMDGASVRSNAGNATAYRFAGTVISRTSEKVTVLTDADITNPNNEEALWSLHASKLWLLPGNDWAILNSVLRVGNIPVFWIPFFYYPADEIVFHPVLGYRSREGTFLQTTTYILGRPRTEAVSENSITGIFGGASENTEKKREGVFLRTTGERRQDPNEIRLSALFDAYVNLGAYVGTEFALPQKGSFGEFNISAGLGLTRNIYPMANANTPFSKYDGVSEWNEAMFFSREIPLRYRFNMTGSFDAGNGSLSWALPFYSDPYVDRDFMRRSEAMDWLAMLRQGATASETDESSDTYLNSYEWRLSGSYNLPAARFSPYISSFSVSNFSSALLFYSRESGGYTGPVTPPNPGKTFFFPNRFTMYSVSASLAGAPFTSGSPADGASPARTGPAPGDALLPDTPRSPWSDAAPGTDDASRAAGASAQGLTGVYTLSPPVLSRKFDFPNYGGPRFSVDYRLTPSTASELQFNSNDWKEQEDIDWGDISTILSRVRSDGNAAFNVNHTGGGLYSGSFSLSGTGAWQDYMFLNEDASEFTTGSAPDRAKIKAARDRAYRETYFTSFWDVNTSVRPLYRNETWGNSSLQYNVKGLLAKTTVDTSRDEPEWDWVKGKWEKDDIESHQFTVNAAANVMDYSQILSVTAVLPPKDPILSGNATFRAWITETGARGRILFPWDDDRRDFDPVYITETLRFGAWGSFQQYVVYTPKKKLIDNINRASEFSGGDFTTLTSNLSLSGFTVSFSAVYARPWRYNPLYNSGAPGSDRLWVQEDSSGRPFGDHLEPRELRFGYIKTFARDSLWGKRLSFSTNVNSSLAFDLQRYTNSRLTFGLGFTLAISNFLDVGVSGNSENAVIFRYFQHLSFFDLPIELYPNQEHNFLSDLANSFRFDNDDLRRASGFKLKALNISMLHHLGDWNAKLTLTMSPQLDTLKSPPSYKFNNEVSFLVRWVPIGEIRTQVDYAKEKLTVK